MQKNPRAALLWGVLFFLGGQVAFFLAINLWRPELRDPEYGSKLALLRRQLADQPERPFVLLLGSSRAAVGFRPDCISLPGMSVQQAPLVFNFGMTGAGPIMELLCLRRLLADGVRPDALILEILPPLLCQRDAFREEGLLHVPRLGWADLPLWQRYAVQPQRLYQQWGESLVSPWFAHRFCIMSSFAPTWLPWKSRQDVWRDMDSLGWLPYPHAVVSEEEHQEGLELAHSSYQTAFEHFEIANIADQALREILIVCRHQRIPTMLLLMPEGSEFRYWYPPHAPATLRKYLSQLANDFDAPLVDAQTWIDDAAFVDGHHLLPSGAAIFSARFNREALSLLLRRISSVAADCADHSE